MATSVNRPEVSSPNLGQYFNTALPSITAPQNQQPSQASGLFSRFGRATQSLLYSPARHATEEAAQGLANRLSELFAQNQDEITNRVRDVFINAMIRRCPEDFHNLERKIQAFLDTPTQSVLDQITGLLNRVSAERIRALNPEITDEGIGALTTLRQLLDDEITEEIQGGAGISVLNITDIAKQRLELANALLRHLINSHEGVLVQTLHHLTQSMNDSQGPIHVLRQQLNHPQHGIIAEGLASLRRDLNSRANPLLRQSKDLMETYRAALMRNASATELLPFIQSLHGKLQELIYARNSIPQIPQVQWQHLEQFEQNLQGTLNNRDSLSQIAVLLAQTNTPSQIISDGFNAQRGILEEAADILIEGIGRCVMQVRNVFSSQIAAPFQQPMVPLDPSAPNLDENSRADVQSQNFLNLGNIATQGRRFLDSLITSAGQALSQQGARSLASLVQHTFATIREHIQRVPEQQHLINTIDPMVQRLQGAIERSSWGELTGVLQDAFRFMQEQQVYLQGLRLPLNPVRTSVSPIPDFIRSINAHQNALQPNEQRTPPRITEEDISHQSILLKARGASVALAKFALEKICGVNASEALYAEIYRTAGIAENDLPAVFRERLFEKIDQADLGVFSWMIKWTAKRVYDCLIPVSSFYVNSILNNVLNLIQKKIKSSSTSPESKEELFVKLARNWLAVMSGAYNQVAAMPVSQARDFNSMMEESIKMPERNGGLTQNELFAAMGKTFLDAFGPQIQWDETVDLYFSDEILPNSPLYFLNPVAKGLNWFCSSCLKAILFVPQWIGNRALQSGAKLALNNISVLQTYSDQSIELMRRNTPTSYATQRLIYRQLQKVLTVLHQSLNDDAHASDGLLSRDTNIKKVEINGLVQYLMEVLNKSQYQTQDQLNNYLQNRAPLRNRAGRELDDTFIPEVMDTVVTIISISLKSISQEDEMQQMLYNGLCIANDSFENRQPVSDEDFAEVEEGIKELTAQILETSILHAINEKLDITNENQKRGIARFVDTLKEQSESFANSIEAGVREISHNNLSTPRLLTKIHSMIGLSTEYNHQQVKAVGQADGNRIFHTETKRHLNALSREVSTRCSPIVERLNLMKNIADEILSNDKLLPPLLLSIRVSRTLGETLRNQRLSSQDLSVCFSQLHLLQQNLTLLRRNHCPLALTDDIQRLCQILSSALQKTQELQTADNLLRSSLPLLSQLKLEKLRLGNSLPSVVLKQLERQLCNLINDLPSSDQKNQLNAGVLAIMVAQNTYEVETATSRFLRLRFQFNAVNYNEETAKLILLRQTNETLQSSLNQASQEFSSQVNNDKSALYHHCTELTNLTGELDRWAQAQRELPIWNLFLFDMQWVTETVKNLAFDRAQAKIKQLFESLYQRHNYIGMINQIFCLPFLREFGKQHLKE